MPAIGRSGLLALGAAALALAIAAVTGLALADDASRAGYLPAALNAPEQATVPPATEPPWPTLGPGPTAEPTQLPCPTAAPTQLPCPTAAPPVTSTAAAAPIVVVPRALDPREWADDGAAIQDVAIEGDRISLTLRHGGGCRVHDQWLVASSWFMESFPLQVDVLLSHDAHGDPCKALITRDVVFDLAPLARQAVEGSPVASGILLLRIRGWPEPVRYDFGP